MLDGVRGTARFDFVRNAKIDRRLVAVNAGTASVSRANVDADCVVLIDKAPSDGIACGEVNAMAALLRGELSADGDLELLQRLFPGPPGPGAGGGRSIGSPANG